MATRKIVCPSCAASLRVPLESIGKKGRCRSCGAVFVIARMPGDADDQALASENDVLGWLGEHGGTEGASKLRPAEKPAPARAAASAPTRPARSDRPARKKFPVRLGHVDEMGAFFLFDPQLLYEEDFRCCFPRKCVVCGGKDRLSVHLVVWSSKLPGRGQFGMRTSYSQNVYELEDLEGRMGHDLLGVLDPIENLPEPYCLPFPYYVCRACSPVGALVTDVRFAPGGTRQECELGIFSLRRAEEFIIAIRGPESRALVQVRRGMERTRDDPWRALPLAIRSRIGRWYERREHERFVVYLPDADFAKTEAGLAGIVLTDQRLVFRKSTASLELALSEQITISRGKSGKPTELQIVCPGHKPAMFTAGPTGAERLRRCLSQQGARTKWVT